MTYPIYSPRKLIEVALPLDLINSAAKEEKAVPRQGHPQALHYWWARRPLAAARAVIFAQLVNDPGYQQGGGFKYGKNKKDAAIERRRLFKIIEDLVQWENTTNEVVVERARAEIRRSWREVCELNKSHPQASTLFNPNQLPPLLDPFAGGGTIPLEAQRLGLEVHASDLNPVPVLINKAMIEIPPKFVGRAPVGPPLSLDVGDRFDFRKEWPGATGLAEDVRRYGSWMRSEAQNRIGHLYAPVEVTPAMARDRLDLKPLVGQKLTIIAWLWARTVKSPNPAFSHLQVPLVSSFILSSKENKSAYVEPAVIGDRFHFTVKIGTPTPEARAGTTAGKRAAFICLMSGAPIDYDYIRAEGKAGRMGQKLMAVVAEGTRGRVYLEPTAHMEAIAASAQPSWKSETALPDNPRDFKTPNYGLSSFVSLFTPRQSVALVTFSDLITEVREKIRHDALSSGLSEDNTGLDAGGSGIQAYAEAISVYLGCALSRLATYNNTICYWNIKGGSVGQIFVRQAIPMSWDFIEINPLEKMSGNWMGGVEWVSNVLQRLTAKAPGHAEQLDAASLPVRSDKVIFSTDPPYYDNIGYADLSDFFYIWLRRSLRAVYPNLFSTLTVPKREELVATPYRHGSNQKAEAFFLEGMGRAMHRIADQAHPAFPVTIYYAFKQSETKADGTTSAGWETFLDAVIRAGFALCGTWPLRTERDSGVKSTTNSLASSIVLVCHRRPIDAPTISRREFLRELNAVLPEALDEMTKGSGEDRSPVAPVDLSQAIIGPGMAVFSKYTAVLEADGSPMTVQGALRLINRFLAEDDFDPDTQFCLHWFEQNGWKEGRFGDADTLSRAKGTSVERVRDAGVVESGGGAVRLRKWSEYSADWNPKAEIRSPVWETLHHIIRSLTEEGDAGAGRLLVLVKDKAEAVRQLAYRLHTLCERQGWAEDARSYNDVITSWTGIETAASAIPAAKKQGSLFE